MNNNEITLYKGNRQAGIVQNDQDSQVNILERLTSDQLAKCKRIYNQALVIFRDLHFFLKGTEANLSDEDRRKIAAAIAAEEKSISYLKKDGKIEISFLHDC